MRYRLIPTRLRHASWHIDGLEEARASAEASYLESGANPDDRTPVLLCEAPLGGLVRHLETIGGNARRVRRS